MPSRLETVSKSLAAGLALAKPMQQRKASMIACELALQATNIDSPLVSKSVEELQQKGVLSKNQIIQLECPPKSVPPSKLVIR
jgi:hypothetical protein